MSEENDLEQEITRLTNRLREQKPAVYDHMTENPVTLPDKNSSDFIEALRKYKENLENLLNQ
tara:strand:- start:118763 stop:118948 length:186 start_codon:yes stop_codon:yes gene_type:complete